MNLASPASPAMATPRAQSLDRVHLAAFLENVPDHVYFKDRDSRFTAVSASQVAYLGLATAAELLGKTDLDFHDEHQARSALEDEQTIIRTGRPVLGKLEKQTWPDGRTTWMLTSKMPLRDEQGEIIGTLGLSRDVTATKLVESKLEQTRKELVESSRQAGMAEVATGVLHNVGNVLNSLNVSTSVIALTLRESKSDSLTRISDLLRLHTADLGHYLTGDPKGRLVPGFIESLARNLAEDRLRLLKELESLQRNVDHIKEIVAMQQSYATMVGVVESLEAVELMEDSLRMNSAALVRHDVRLVRDFQPVPPVLAERGKVLQILINLIRNAKYAADEGGAADKTITVGIAPGKAGRVRLSVRDNGIGIRPENLTRIFQHGFTTKATGHGFGLHSSANTAKELQGSLTAHSEGPGTGATFILDLPATDITRAGI